MINKSNDLPSFVNETNLPKIVDKLTDASNIKITGNKYGNRVQTVIDKIVEKADDITKAIEQEVVNNSYSFKVGTGDVDVSADVEDGFGEVGIKGTTYQNVLPVGIFDSKENFYALGGEVSNLYSSFDGGYITLNATGDYGNAFVKLEKTLLKQNSKYTLILDIKNTTLTLKEEANPNNFSFAVASAHPSEAFVDWCFLGGNAYPLKNGIQKFLLTTKSDFAGVNWSTRMFISNKVASGSITFRYLLLEGDHTNNPNLPSYFEGIIGAGDKSKNLFNKDNIKQTVLNLGAVGSNCDEVVSQLRCSLRKISCKPNTKYTIKSDKEISVAIGSIGNNNIALGDSNWRNIYNSYTYTTPSDAIELAVNIAKTDNTNIDIDYVKNFNIQIEEGETSTSYEPYYDGHKIEILSHGKNLTNLEDMPLGRLENSGKVVMSPTSAYKVTPNFIKIEPTRKVCFYYEYDENYISTPTHNMIAYYDKNFSYIGAVYDLPPKGILKTPPAQAYYLRLRVRKEAIKLSLIFESSIVYEPYASDKTQILLDEPLMRLPNGVCDEITRDGKLIRRVGKVVLNGSENWKIAIHNNKSRFDFDFKEIKTPSTWNDKTIPNMICSNLIVQSFNQIYSNGESGINYYHANSDRLIVISLGNNCSLAEFKQWLSQNPTTVYYELSTPVITELPAPCLRIFKDGHLIFNTLVAPESNHVVQLNKSAQIERNIREVQGLDNRINVLENNYDNLMLSTISRLNDLELDYTLK